MIAQLQSAEDEAAGAAGRPTGRLRITCPQEFGHLHIAPLVAAFLEVYPEISVDVLMIDRIVNLVDEGYDIALRIGELPPSGLSAIRVGALRNMVCAAPGYLGRFGLPLAPRDLSEGHRIILTGSHREWRFGADRQTVIRCPQHLIVSSVAGAIEIARRNWGLCRALSYQVAQDLAQGTLQPVLEGYEPGPVPVHLVHPEGRRPSAKLRVFADFAAAHLRSLPVLRGSV
ncbi:LysR family transcriptional regulator [Thioclava sp. BHET1]|nr:LysR family transcriptional regulator [Thioclava sp. BHET1]